MGIALHGDTQMMLVDTPGVFEPHRRLDRAMVQAAWGGAQDADVILLVIDSKAGLGPKVERIVEGLKNRPEPKMLILNKVDIAAKDKLLIHADRLTKVLDFTEVLMVSAETGDGLAHLKDVIASHLPEGPWHFPADQVSDATDRVSTSEITREQLYLQLHAELPYATAIETENYQEREDGSVEIHQQIKVERPSQRAIILGKGGSRLKEIGSAARAEISKFLGCRVHLYLHVKVDPKWDEDRGLYRDIGLDWVE
jgi:GTP-binding protein Era